MKRENKLGERLWKVITIRVFEVGNLRSTVRRFRAAHGRAHTEDGVQELLEHLAADLEKRFPDDDFSLVELGSARFNFVWRARKDSAGTGRGMTGAVAGSNSGPAPAGDEDAT